MPNKNTLTWRVKQLEGNYSALDTKLDDVLMNHLPGIQKEIASLKTTIGVATALNVGVIILGIILSKLYL